MLRAGPGLGSLRNPWGEGTDGESCSPIPPPGIFSCFLQGKTNWEGSYRCAHLPRRASPPRFPSSSNSFISGLTKKKRKEKKNKTQSVEILITAPVRRDSILQPSLTRDVASRQPPPAGNGATDETQSLRGPRPPHRPHPAP